MNTTEYKSLKEELHENNIQWAKLIDKYNAELDELREKMKREGNLKPGDAGYIYSLMSALCDRKDNSDRIIAEMEMN